MDTLTRGTAATLSALALVASGTLAGTAWADDRPAAEITVRSSDDRVASGEQLVLRGRLTSPTGRALAGGLVKVQTLRDGTWVDLTGARVGTDVEGRYRVRVVLSQRGARDLRVVGDPAGDRLRNARARTVVQVG